MDRKRSIVWQNFTIEGADSTKAKCNFCRTLISYKAGSNTNLMRHLQRKPVAVLNTVSQHQA